MVYLKSVENVITLGKLIGLLFLFCLPLLSILFLKTKEERPRSPCNGNHFSSNSNNKVGYVMRGTTALKVPQDLVAPSLRSGHHSRPSGL